MNTMPKIALGAWSWGAGAAGGDQVFGSHLFEDDLRPVFDKAMECGLTLWDTAAVYGEEISKRILGNFVNVGGTARVDRPSSKLLLRKICNQVFSS